MKPIQAVRRRLLLVLGLLGVLVPGLLGVPQVAALSNGQAAGLVLGYPTLTQHYATASRLLDPGGVAVDPTTGAVFVADSANYRVLRFSSLSSLTNGAAAEGVLGQSDFASRTNATTAQGLSVPTGVAVDSSGRLWVVDTLNNRVLRFDAAASKPNGAAANGLLGQPNFTSKTWVASAQGLNSPTGVAVDASGRLWVADRGNNRVLRFDTAASKPNGAAADGVLGQPNFTALATAATAQVMSAPGGVVLDAGGSLWVADNQNHRVLRFGAAAGKPNGAAANAVLGQPNFTSHTAATTQQGMNVPTGVAVDTSGRLWVVDRDNNRVLRFDGAAAKPNGAAASAVLGQSTFAGNLRGTTARGLSEPGGVAVDTSGRLWVADSDNNRVLRFDDAAGKSNGASADGVLGNSSFNNPWPVAADTLRSPSAIAVDPATGKVFVADSSNNRVLRFAARASLSNGAAAEAVLGQLDFTSCPAANSAQGMNFPTGVAVDTSGRLWVADQGNSRVLRFDAAASKPSGAAADGVLGQPNFTSGNFATSAQGMYYPSGVAVDTSGRLWVVDSWNNRVLRFDAAASKSNGATANAVLGQPNFTSSTAATTAQGMRKPSGVTVDTSGHLWVADYDNNRVLRFDAAAGKTNGAVANGVLGQPSFTSNTATVTAQGLNAPAGVAVDTSGRLWVAELWSHRVVRFDAAASKPNGAAADGVLGQPNFTSNTAATSPQGMVYAKGVAVDTGGRLWAADSGNNRVLLFEDAAPPTLLRLPDQRATPGQILYVPVFIEPASGLFGASLTVRFDSRVLRPHGVLARPGSLNPGWLLAANTSVTDQVRVALTSPGTPVNGTGTLVELEFEVVGSAGSISPLQFVQVALNDGVILVTTQDGSFTVVEPRYQISVQAVQATTRSPLANTTVQASGASSLACLTNLSGSCALTNLPGGAYTVALTKTDEVTGISPFDASLILQHDAELLTLSGDALTAGDVNGNGQVTALDASLVLQYAAGLRGLPFPAGKVWALAPLSYLPLAQNQQAVVPGVLIGDVSGHLPPGALGLQTQAAREVGGLQVVEQAAPDAQGYRTAEVQLLAGQEGLLSLEAALRFDPAQVTDVQVSPGTLTGALVEAHASPDGQVRLALASARPLGSGTLLTLHYRSSGSAGWSLAHAEANDGGTLAWLPTSGAGWRIFLPAVSR